MPSGSAASARGLTIFLLILSACASPPRHHPAGGALGPYSGSVEVGELCFLSGKIGERGGSFAHEVHTAIDAIEAALARAGFSVADVVSATVYLTDMADYAELNAIYAQRFPEPYPARACVAVKGLPGDARVELQVIAARTRRPD